MSLAQNRCVTSSFPIIKELPANEKLLKEEGSK